MNNKIAWNAGSILILGCVSFAYLLWLSEFIPKQFALAANFIVIPAIFGVVGFFLLRSTLWVKLILVAVIPVAHLVYFGGDPAKPGLENMLALLELAFFEAGVLIGFLWAKYFAPPS